MLAGGGGPGEGDGGRGDRDAPVPLLVPEDLFTFQDLFFLIFV